MSEAFPRTAFSRAARRAGFVTLSFGLVATGALLHAACEKVSSPTSAAPKAVDPEQVLAKIDDIVITVGDFQARINQQSPYVRARYTSMERKRDLFAGVKRIVHQHRIAYVDQQSRFARCGKFDPLNREIIGCNS